MANATKPIVKLPTKLTRQCGKCGEVTSVMVNPGDAPPAFKCKRCTRASRRHSPFHPHGVSRSRICSGTGAMTRTGSLFFEIGTVDFARMQLQAGRVGTRHELDLPARAGRLVAVDVVAEDRKAHRGAVHAQLMRAAGDRLEREPGESRCEPRRARRHLPWGRACPGLDPVAAKPPGGDFLS